MKAFKHLFFALGAALLLFTWSPLAVAVVTAETHSECNNLDSDPPANLTGLCHLCVNLAGKVVSWDDSGTERFASLGNTPRLNNFEGQIAYRCIYDISNPAGTEDSFPGEQKFLKGMKSICTQASGTTTSEVNTVTDLYIFECEIF